jgi:hypothetical protein
LLAARELVGAPILEPAELAALGDDGYAAMARAMPRPAELSEEQALQLWDYTDAVLGTVYNIWLSRRAGLASEEDCIETRRGTADMLDFAATRIVWDRYKAGALPREFIADFESELKRDRPQRVDTTLREIIGDLRRLPSGPTGGSLE